MADVYKLIVGEQLRGRPLPSLDDAMAAGVKALAEGKLVRVEQWGAQPGPIATWDYDPDMQEWLQTVND